MCYNLKYKIYMLFNINFIIKELKKYYKTYNLI